MTIHWSILAGKCGLVRYDAMLIMHNSKFLHYYSGATCNAETAAAYRYTTQYWST
jgi:hypothetical protein